jgi:cell division protease FtsH
MPSGRYNFDDDGPGSPRPPRLFDLRNPKLLVIILVMTAVFVLLMLGQQTNWGARRPQQLSWKAVLAKMEAGDVKTLIIYQDGRGPYSGTLKITDGKVEVEPSFVTPPGQYRRWDKLTPNEIEHVTKVIDEKGIDAKYIEYPAWKDAMPTILLLAGLAFAFWYFFIYRYRASGGPGSVLSFGKSRATLVSKEKKSKTTFADVAGIEEAKEEVQEIINFLKDPRRFQRLGGRIPKGVLLVGAPGTGKTLLARAIAGEADVPFYSISGSDFVEMFVGVGASRVRDLFQQAKGNSPCVIFLDEIDAVGRRRGTGLGGGHDEREQTLNAILVEMDGFESDDKVIVMAATNRPDVLDPALLRPGRFDRHITIDPPDVGGRKEIFKVYARKVKLAENVDLEKLARMTPSFTGANIESMMNEAAIGAVLRNKDAVEMDDLEEARDKVLWGREKRSRKITEDDRELTAIHEGGHAIVAMLSPEVEPLHKVTIISRGHYLGATMQLPVRDEYNMGRKKLLGEMRVLYGGRAAEEVFAKEHDISNGAASDIRRATEIARRMICEWGMSDELGPISYETAHDNVFLGYDMVRAREYSEATAQRIDEEVTRLVHNAHQEARQLIEENREKIERIKSALLVEEVLNREQVDALMKGQPLPPKAAEGNGADEPAPGAKPEKIVPDPGRPEAARDPLNPETA